VQICYSSLNDVHQIAENLPCSELGFELKNWWHGACRFGFHGVRIFMDLGPDCHGLVTVWYGFRSGFLQVRYKLGMDLHGLNTRIREV
jgi:hypothetical protein